MEPFFEDGDRAQLYQGDCLEVMPELEGSFDAIICDLPYGITDLKDSWDQIIPFEPLWENYKRLIKPNGAIVLFGSQPFTTDLICSNREWFRYSWIWKKNKMTGFLDCQKKPMKAHEDVLIFGSSLPVYYPQMIQRSTEELRRLPKKSVQTGGISLYSKQWTKSRNRIEGIEKHPSTILDFSAVHSGRDKVEHPTQKPIELLSFLIRSYSLPNDRILDNTAGSFSTGVAAILNGRNFVGIEREEKYCCIGEKRIRDAITEVDSMLIKPWELDEKPIAPPQQMDLLEEPA